MPIPDPLAQLIEHELELADPGSELTHHILRYCREALGALDRGERHIARCHLHDARTIREENVARIGRRALTPAEHEELLHLRRALRARRDTP